MKALNLLFLGCLLCSSAFAGTIPPVMIEKSLIDFNITQQEAAKKWKSDQLKAVLVAGDRTPNEIVVNSCDQLEKSDYEGRTFDRQNEKTTVKLDTNLAHSLPNYCMNLLIKKNLKPSKESYLGNLDFSKDDWKKLNMNLSFAPSY